MVQNKINIYKQNQRLENLAHMGLLTFRNMQYITIVEKVHSSSVLHQKYCHEAHFNGNQIPSPTEMKRGSEN